MGKHDADHLKAAYAACDASLREQDRDRWLSCLFAPEDLRPYLHALYAFNLEIARVREVVSDPFPGEVRLQWWRDVIEGAGRGDVQASPLAYAFTDTMATCRLPQQPLLNLIEARTFDLYDDIMPTLHDLEGYCGETSSALIQLATLILARGADPKCADCAGHAGVAYALTGLLRAFPWHCTRGQIFMPGDILARHGVTRDRLLAGPAGAAIRAVFAEMRGQARRHLAETRARVKSVAPQVASAFFPIALVEPLLLRMERAGYDPYKSVIDLPQWQRQWIMWKTSRKAARE
ncbi:phytoene/squalene synthase family protein [Methylovirgula sp. 4M-Z18]|uniref:phytoene/squalene synthase family protein n=1 Tax=Methylovirgula sp. 4M-Z18 TaxID=2293567 RepID=UPI000E2F7C29|nr:phytoene/squalene synthase family protein [Methylovirgula sp. 4M-Z18]RFB81021.1 squalene/phytoene synthase family protein [Methylovirgula sp. 4M-Z18]